MDGKLFVGQTFASFDQFKQELDYFEKQTKQKFTIKSSRTIKSAYVTHPIKMDLVYYEIEYACVHRKGFKPSGKGIRKSSTLRKSCPAMITLRASKCGEYLAIRRMLENHEGHELSEKVIKHLYLNRKPGAPDSSAADADKKDIESTCEDTKLLTLEGGCDSKIQNIITLLNTTYHCNVQVLCDENGVFKGMYFSSTQMRHTMQAWPEFITLDCTYNLINNDYTVYLLSVEDSNGKREIVGVSVVGSEDRDTFSFILNSFKIENGNVAHRIKCFITDKDLVKRNVIKALFPDVQTFICLFHTMRSFKRELTGDKFKISRRERELSLEFIQKLINCTAANYDVIYSDFEEIAPNVIVDYFTQNWEPIRDELKVKNMKTNFLNVPNNRFESITSKLKQCVGQNNEMCEFIQKLFIFLTSQQCKSDSLAANHILKTPVCTFKQGTDEYSYQQYLTNYASEYVLKQIDSIQLERVVKREYNGEQYRIESSTGTIETSPIHCECRQNTSLALPCKHILAVRKKCNLNLFDEDLFDVRWSRSYYLQCQQDNAEEDRDKPKTTKEYCKSVSEKRKELLALTNSIANTASFSSNSVYEYRLKQLAEIEACWRSGKEITVNAVECNESLSSEDSSMTQGNSIKLAEVVKTPVNDVSEGSELNSSEWCRPARLRVKRKKVK